MKRIGLKLSTTLTFALLAVLAMAYPAHTLAQGGASVHGHVINAVGMPVNKGEVRLSQDRTSTAKDRKYLYTFPLDQNGDFKGSGITPGSYIVFVFQNVGNADASAAAADKAIAADPKSPLPYYLKGQALISKATVDSKTGVYVLPPGCEEAYQKYIDLAPTGPYVNDVKAILAQSQTKVENKYKAKK
jgi:hypothetical protein